MESPTFVADTPVLHIPGLLSTVFPAQVRPTSDVNGMPPGKKSAHWVSAEPLQYSSQAKASSNVPVPPSCQLWTPSS